MPTYGEMERWPDDKLLRSASGGNTDAFQIFCVRTLPSLHRYVKYQCRQRRVDVNLAEDFCHSTLIRAIDHINSCKEDGCRPLPTVSVAWIKQIAFNLIRTWQRDNKRMSFVEDVYVESRRSVSAEDIDEYEEILKFFQWLNDNERDMLEMVFVNQLSIVEAGERINLNKWAAYKTYERGLCTLRDLLQEHGVCVPSSIAED